ncbi:MAG: riboflavin synthase [Pseudomonadota bacterium]
MFSGIITDVGHIVAHEQHDDSTTMRIACGYDAQDLQLGESIACSGVCLSVTAYGTQEGKTWFDVQLSPETMEKTTCESWRLGQHVNLERALRLQDRLGGHLVQGHVDGTAEILQITQVAGKEKEDVHHVITFGCDQEFARFLAPKGSVCLDGVSLTINGVGDDNFLVNIIPITLQNTCFQWLHAGDHVNLEIDTIMRYCARLMEKHQA